MEFGEVGMGCCSVGAAFVHPFELILQPERVVVRVPVSEVEREALVFHVLLHGMINAGAALGKEEKAQAVGYR